MPIIERRIVIPASPDRVWEVLSDVPAQPKWMRDLKAIRFVAPSGSPTAPPPDPLRPGVGTRAVGTVRMFGLEQSDPVEIDAFDPPRHFGLRHLGRFTGRGDFWLTPVHDGTATLVHWREELLSPAVRLGRLGRLVDGLFAPLFELVFREDLRRLRRLVVVSDGRAAGTPRRARPTAALGAGPG